MRKEDAMELGEDATIIDVMEWMINTQLGRRNLPPQQRIAVVKKFERKIQEQAKERQSEAGREFGNGKNSSSPNGEKLNVHTDKQLARLAGVSEKTYRMGKKILDSNNDEVKEKVLLGEMSINSAIE